MAQGSHTSLLFFATHHGFRLNGRFANHSPIPLVPAFPFPACAFLMRPHSSVILQYRNINLLSIDYVFRPRLRSRLPQSRSALLWKPWIFGHKDSHLILATHSGILSSMNSTAPSGTASPLMQCSSTNSYPVWFLGFGVVFQPRKFSARDLSTSELLRTLSMCGCF